MKFVSEFLYFFAVINRFTLLGLILIILGFFLSPFFIGFPLIFLGIILLIGAILYPLLDVLPGGKILKNYLEKIIQKVVKNK